MCWGRFREGLPLETRGARGMGNVGLFFRIVFIGGANYQHELRKMAAVLVAIVGTSHGQVTCGSSFAITSPQIFADNLGQDSLR